MPRAVTPWTWRRVLRDDGPEDEGFLLAMLILATYMDRDGLAYPSQTTWARAARKSVRQLQRYIKRGRTEGWLRVFNAGRGGKGWNHDSYCCVVPDHIELDDTDEKLVDYTDHPHAGDTSMSRPTSSAHDTRMSPPTPHRAVAGDTGEVLQATSGCRTNSGSENSRSITHAQEEGTLARPALAKTVYVETDEERNRRIQAAKLKARDDIARLTAEKRLAK